VGNLQGISIALSVVIGLLYKVLSVGIDWTTWQSACATCDQLRPGPQLCGLTPALSARVGPGLHLHTTCEYWLCSKLHTRWVILTGIHPSPFSVGMASYTCRV